MSHTREEIFHQIDRVYPHLLNGAYNPDQVIDFFIENMEINQKRERLIRCQVK